MRNTNFLFILLATLLIFNGCSSDEENSNHNSPILGTWTAHRTWENLLENNPSNS
jgi:outer membrane biogenesis lipoprotein LolB